MNSPHACICRQHLCQGFISASGCGSKVPNVNFVIINTFARYIHSSLFYDCINQSNVVVIQTASSYIRSRYCVTELNASIIDEFMLMRGIGCQGYVWFGCMMLCLSEIIYWSQESPCHYNLTFVHFLASF